ncbi:MULTISPECIES: lysoplasmalogenase [Gordonia]|uniref:lysoplasmalogenase n=1 Tax=Gordonia TaxID=2053 RepID=UPI0007EA1885|nr:MULTISPECIES: lysoplasmalogenase [Gordonia]MCM3896246.1 lysoplasmalogenase [Gordonia sputi]OBA65829.1 hypothetical protein A5777_19455 [Gordonia sp. 852002-10350_SCH5691597]
MGPRRRAASGGFRHRAASVGFPLAYALSSAVASAAGAFGTRRAAALTKPIPLALLAGRALLRRQHHYSGLGIDDALLAGAIAFSAAGDRAMLLEEFTPTDTEADRMTKDRRLATGAALFGVAQLCYSTLFWRRGARPTVQAFAPRMVALGESAAVLAANRPRPLLVLSPYGTSLAAMSTLAGAVHSPQPSARIGGLLFLASDFTILNRRHLISGATARRIGEVWVLASYFAAQYLLTDAVDVAASADTVGEID